MKSNPFLNRCLQGIPISVRKSTLYLVSLDDGWSGKPDLARAMAITIFMATFRMADMIVRQYQCCPE